MKEKLRIGIIDDDQSKITQIITRLMEGVKHSSPEKQDKYSKFEFIPIEIEIKEDINEMLNNVVEHNLDCVIVDYKLSSYTVANYTGIEFAQTLEERVYDFPIFVLTSYEDDLFSNEIYNAYQVFDFERYLNEVCERTELHFKIIEQILKFQKQREKWKKELKSLLPLAGKTEEIDSRLLELDTKLERSINGTCAIPNKLKKDLDSNKVIELLDKIDLILERD
ncbi:hypothetical protein AB2T63_03765 [Clostridium butyricum]|uniref:hypothetical protein n=1 Tax=Clostridium butyricum TaxID=1492 RepID=UPI0034667F41